MATFGVVAVAVVAVAGIASSDFRAAREAKAFLVAAFLAGRCLNLGIALRMSRFTFEKHEEQTMLPA